MNRKFYLTTLIVLLIGVVSFSFKSKTTSCKLASLNYPGGASANLGAGYTGASWDNGGLTCSQSGCHRGGNYNPTTTLTLLSGTTPVTQYVAGTAYTLSIKIAAASGTPKYAFNAMCATTAYNTNINKWGTMPTGTRNTSAGGRNYVEQSSARSATGTSPTSYYTVNIPWTAPVVNTGSVTFYAEGMAVNGTGGTSGDSPAPPISMTITETFPLPVKFSSITAQKAGNAVNVNWVTGQESNVQSYSIEHSTDGAHFETLGSVTATNTTASYSYNYTHNAVLIGKHFYRVAGIDIDGTKSYSEIASITFNIKNSFTITPNPVFNIIHLPAEFTGSNYVINNMEGKRMKAGVLQENSIAVGNIAPGAYVLTIADKNGNTQTSRFIKK
jgi:hypothetical protein